MKKLVIFFWLGFLVSVGVWAQDASPYIPYEKADVIQSVAFSPDGTLIVSGSRDGTIRIWDVGTGRELYTLQDGTGSVEFVTFSPDGKLLLSTLSRGLLLVWDLASKKKICTFSGYRGVDNEYEYRVAFSPDGSLIIVGLDDGTIRILDTAMMKEIRSIRAGCTALSFSPDGKLIVCAANRIISILDLETERLVQKFQGHSGPISSVFFNHDGDMLVSCSGGNDTEITLWNVATGQEIRTLHEEQSYKTFFSPDGQKIISVSVYPHRGITIWDVTTGEKIIDLKGHSGFIFAAAISSDGNFLVSGSQDRTIKIWETSTGKELKTLIPHVHN